MAGKVKAKKAGRHQFYDLELLVSIIFLCVFGLVMIYSASSYKAQLDYGKRVADERGTLTTEQVRGVFAERFAQEA